MISCKITEPFWIFLCVNKMLILVLVLISAIDGSPTEVINSSGLKGERNATGKPSCRHQTNEDEEFNFYTTCIPLMIVGVLVAIACCRASGSRSRYPYQYPVLPYMFPFSHTGTNTLTYPHCRTPNMDTNLSVDLPLQKCPKDEVAPTLNNLNKAENNDDACSRSSLSNYIDIDDSSSEEESFTINFSHLDMPMENDYIPFENFCNQSIKDPDSDSSTTYDSSDDELCYLQKRDHPEKVISSVNPFHVGYVYAAVNPVKPVDEVLEGLTFSTNFEKNHVRQQILSCGSVTSSSL